MRNFQFNSFARSGSLSGIEIVVFAVFGSMAKRQKQAK